MNGFVRPAETEGGVSFFTARERADRLWMSSAGGERLHTSGDKETPSWQRAAKPPVFLMLS
jgi:hypothetical protein